MFRGRGITTTITNNGFSSTKVKANLQMSLGRMEIIKTKKSALVKQEMRTIATLLVQNNATNDTTTTTNDVAKARIRTEALIRDDNYREAMEIIQLQCEFMKERVKQFDLVLYNNNNACPPDLVTAVATIIYASVRIEGIPELDIVRDQIKLKYKKLVTDIIDHKNYTYVNERVVKLLSIESPDPYIVTRYLQRIAELYNLRVPDVSTSTSSTTPTLTTPVPATTAENTNIIVAPSENVASSTPNNSNNTTTNNERTIHPNVVVDNTLPASTPTWIIEVPTSVQDENDHDDELSKRDLVDRIGDNDIVEPNQAINDDDDDDNEEEYVVISKTNTPEEDENEEDEELIFPSAPTVKPSTIAISGPISTVPIAVLEKEYINVIQPPNDNNDTRDLTTESTLDETIDNTERVVSTLNDDLDSNNNDNPSNMLPVPDGNEVDARDDSNQDSNIDDTNNTSTKTIIEQTKSLSNEAGNECCISTTTTTTTTTKSTPPPTKTKIPPCNNSIDGGKVDYRKVKTYVRHLKR